MKTAPAVTAGAALLFAGFGAGSLWKDMDLQEERRAAAAHAENLGLQIGSLEDEVKGFKQEIDAARLNASKLQEALDGAQAQLVRGTTKPSEGSTKAGAPQVDGGPKDLSKMLIEMMKAPEMKEVMQRQQLTQIDLLYGGLYNRLHLNDTDKQELKKMIAERVKEESELGLRLMGDGLSPEKQAAVLKAFADSKNASDLKIKTFLNNEQDYQMFQGWETSKADRMALTLGNSAFSAVGEPLSTEQEDQLVKAMTGARTRRTDIPDLSKIENFASWGADDKTTERILAGFKTQSAEVAASAASFLSPKQLEALKSMQEQQQAMQAAGIKIGASMFNKKKQP